MTRSEFIEDINTFSDLRDFCCDYGLSYLDEFIDGDDLDSEVDEDIKDCDFGWGTILDCLRNIASITGADFYRKDGWLDYVEMDDGDFRELKEDVCRTVDENEDWDPEEDEEDDDYYDDIAEENAADEYVFTDVLMTDPNEGVMVDEFLEPVTA